MNAIEKKSKELMRYANILVNDEIEDRDGNHIRITIFHYMKENIRYYHKMINGTVVEVIDIG